MAEPIILGDDLELMDLAQAVKPVVGSIKRTSLDLESALSGAGPIERATAVVGNCSLDLELSWFPGL